LLTRPAERRELARRAALAAKSLPRWDEVATALLSLWGEVAHPLPGR
jgi:hypothetical protein